MTIVLDTETTGFVAGTDEILQLSIIDTDGTVLFNEYFRPTAHTSWDDAEAVNHISPSMIADCPVVSERLAVIQSIIDTADSIIGYNTEFDISFLQAVGVMFPDGITYIDVMRDFAPIYGEWSESHEAWKWQKLTTCADYYGYEWGVVAHNAVGDCFATLHCFKAMQRSV